MAKSSGVFLTIEELKKKGFHPLDYRYFLLGAHYKTQLKFTFEALEAAKSGRTRLMEKVVSLKGRLSPQEETSLVAPLSPSLLSAKAQGYLNSFEENAALDLNMPRCLSDLWGLIKDESIPATERLGVLYRMDEILGLELSKAAQPTDGELDEISQNLIQEREGARKRKDFKRSDEIRVLLLERGIVIEDTASGVRWKKR
jgi:cysteinyl-tRNA synthetase